MRKVGVCLGSVLLFASIHRTSDTEDSRQLGFRQTGFSETQGHEKVSSRHRLFSLPSQPGWPPPSYKASQPDRFIYPPSEAKERHNCWWRARECGFLRGGAGASLITNERAIPHYPAPPTPSLFLRPHQL